MTEVKKSKGFIKSNVVLTGTIKFSNLKTAKGFMDSEENKKFGLVLLIKSDDPQIEMLRGLHKEAIDHELGSIPKVKHAKTITAPLSIDVEVDGDGNETGMTLIRISRHEKFGAPGVFDSSAIKVDREFIRKGSDIKVLLTVRSYSVAGKIGLTMKLEAVQIISEVEGPVHTDKAPSAFTSVTKTKTVDVLPDDISPF
jgi:hypothetical protein